MQGTKEAPPTPPLPLPLAMISAVLGNDDILREILLRLGFPTTLVRAALVSKCWLRIVSDPAFLRRFRERHPPHLLGFFVQDISYLRPQFLPVSRAPELASVRRPSVADGFFYIRDSRHGRLLVRVANGWGRLEPEYEHAVLRPLQPRQGKTTMTPPLPRKNCGSRDFYFFPEDGSEDGAIAVEGLITGSNFIAEVSTLQSGVWSARAVAEIELLHPPGYVTDVLPPVNRKTYMRTSYDCVLELDLATMNISVLQLPDRVRKGGNFKLSCGEDLGLFLVHAEGPLLTFWHHETGSNGKCSWKLVDGTIRVREAWKRGKDVKVLAVDGNHEYVFLRLKETQVLMTLHTRSRTEKVYHGMNFQCTDRIVSVYPFTMVWPPIFPTLSDENSQ